MNHHKERKQNETKFEELIQGLLDNDYGCCDDFVNAPTITGLREKMLQLNETGGMNAAGLGQHADHQKNQQIRGDKIKWIEKDSQNQFEGDYLRMVEAFIVYLNRTCYTAIKDYESHYANYEKKRFYKRHLDQFKHDIGRKFSIVLYLNEDWQLNDGGILSLYLASGQQKDISPLAGRMVFFKSDEIEHEVHPSFTRDRASIAGWLKG